GTPNLLPADDSGASNSDHVTSVTRPRFTGTAAPDAPVQLLVNGAVNGSGQADANGNWTIQLSAPLADGSYSITAQTTDLAGNASPVSAALAPPLVIPSTPPAAPGVPGLLPADDSGVSNSDHITNVAQPRFLGTADPNSFVQLF